MKRIIALLLIVMMVLSVVSCASTATDVTTAKPTTTNTPTTNSQKNNTPTTNVTGSDGTGATQSPVVTTSPAVTSQGIDMASVYDAYDLGGETYYLMCLAEDKSVTTVVNHYNQFTAEEDDGDQITAATFIRQKKIEELFDCKIESFTDGCTRTNVGSLLKQQVDTGSSDICAALVGGYSLIDCVKKGVLYDLSEISTVRLDREWWNRQLTKDLTINGKTYAAGGDISIRHMLSMGVTFFNKDLLEKDVPGTDLYQMVRNGEWTIDELTKYSKLLTRETTGDDEFTWEDQIGFVCEPAYFMFFINAAGEYAFKNDGNTVTYNLPGNSRAEQTVSKLFDLYKDSCSLNIKDYPESNAGTYIEFMNDKVGFFVTQLLCALNFREMESDYGLLPLPKLDKEQDGYHSTQSYYFSGYMVIPSTVASDDVETIGALIDAFAYYGHKYNRQAVYEYTYESMKVLRDEDSVDMFNLILDTQMTDLAWLYNIDNMRTTVSNMSTTGSYATPIKKSKNTVALKLKEIMQNVFEVNP